ncbi:hypothetical protein ABB37_04529 [Leptomonas pyrrhocoris]|uniref:C2 domain-containing protein n=1 Tax=Leptomonas pyrrhocoris TaxID=157538 RepID=A0A0N0DW27_LEPPY|nr:hypothetical protein ABB37_04529 [Leptomonas pyrrhocoris]KPA81191.1 hypothetical protein ABB37_04529 [Leptomonas pyrrhocoris]|eukprot:XP_015659630.1 hypothetical protein ABB37_04529 [Leptomonas pyrrhocoris]
MAAHMIIPLPVRFSSNVHLTLHQAFLASAGVLLSDPVARVHVVTVKTTRPTKASSNAQADAQNDGVRIVLNAREVGKTKPCFFTAHPSFNESFDFTVAETSALTSLAAPSALSNTSAPNRKKRDDGADVNSSGGGGNTVSVVDHVVITLESADGTAFYGEAYAPFSPHCSSAAPAAAPVRVMLAPRNAQDVSDPLFLQDNALLAERHLDDFGFVTISWEVAVVPHGGALLGNEAAAAPTGLLPVGLALRATWLARAAAYTRGAQYTTSVEFGGLDRFIFSDPAQPVCLTLQGGAAEAQLRRATFHCTVQSAMEPSKSHEVTIPLPLPPLNVAAARNRDIHWVAPARTSQGLDLGLLLVSMRVSSTPLTADAPRCPDEACLRINDPQHQEEHQHVAQLWGMRAPPQTPPGAYQPIAWESQQHVAEAAQRRWKRQCVVEARPALEHLRHLFDVLMGRTTLDDGVAHVAATFCNKSPAEISAGDLRELMVAFAFHASKLTVQAAARFCFVALRRDVPDAVAAEEVQYIVDHCLVERTVEMPAGERRRWVTDLFASVPVVSYADFVKYFIHNYAMWAAFGVPLTVETAASSMQHCHAALQHQQQSSSSRCGTPRTAAAVVVDVALFPSSDLRAPAPAADRSAGVPSNPEAAAATASPSNVWRTFVVRVAQTPSKAFSVTAHVSDRISDVMAIVEGNVGIKVTRQEWRLAGTGGSTSPPGSTAAATSAAPPAPSMKLLDPSLLVGNTTLGLPSALRNPVSSSSASASSSPFSHGAGNTQEVWIYEAEATILLRFHVTDCLHSKKDWQERVQAKEKVLKLRAAVQRKTLIPLSRCTLSVKHQDGAVTTLQDRHTVAHYHLVSGDVIDVSHD